MIVAGGVYYERCLTPSVEELFGSGGRAAVALSQISDVTLHTFFPKSEAQNVVLNMAPFGVTPVVHPSEAVIEFFYSFPLSLPRIAPIPIPRADTVQVRGGNVIRFGCLEGDFVVEAETAVYDPQSGNKPRSFGENGSRAERLALVLNEGELRGLSSVDAEIDDLPALVGGLVDKPDVVVVKAGPRGAHVFERGAKVGTVPVYKSASVYKIGSGDIFTAMFAHCWAERQMSAIDAADAASRYVSLYVENRLPTMGREPPNDRIAVEIELRDEPYKIYLAGSFFSAEHIWLVDEVRTAIDAFRVPCFSPMHDVGIGTGKEFAEADIEALDDDCDVMLAMLSDNDPGTLMEIGYAVAQKLPVFVVSENPGPQDLTMIAGTGCHVHNDLSTAIYHAAWAALE